MSSTSKSMSNVDIVDLAELELREVNARLQQHNGGDQSAPFRVINPNGAHAVACGLDTPATVEIHGHVGYYCAGMNKQATVIVHGRRYHPNAAGHPSRRQNR